MVVTLIRGGRRMIRGVLFERDVPRDVDGELLEVCRTAREYDQRAEMERPVFRLGTPEDEDQDETPVRARGGRNRTDNLGDRADDPLKEPDAVVNPSGRPDATLYPEEERRRRENLRYEQGRDEKRKASDDAELQRRDEQRLKAEADRAEADAAKLRGDAEGSTGDERQDAEVDREAEGATKRAADARHAADKRPSEKPADTKPGDKDKSGTSGAPRPPV